jgi:hypothetical protein
MNQSKNRDPKNYFRICKFNHLQNVLLVIALVFMCYLLSRQASVIIKRQDLHHKVYKVKDKDTAIVLVDTSTEHRNNEEFRVMWDEETVDFFKSLLDINNDSRISDSNKTINCHLGKEFILTGLPGPEDSFEDYIWQYLSLQALSSEYPKLKPFITATTKNLLKNLFDKYVFKLLVN